jgi:hypothetical protein
MKQKKASRAMNDSFRTSDADRDRVTGLLRDHFAAGRLTSEELDERLTATLSARTFGDLRHVLADLPGPAPVPQQASHLPRQAAPLRMARRRRPRILPLVLLALVAALLIHGAGWFFVAAFQAVLLLWLAVCLAVIFAAARFYRRIRRDLRAGHGRYRGQGWPGGYTRHQFGSWNS